MSGRISRSVACAVFLLVGALGGCGGAVPAAESVAVAPADVGAATSDAGVGARNEKERVVVAGTGVSLVPPPGVARLPFGTMLASDGLEVLVAVLVGPAANLRDDDPMEAAVYPGGPEAVRVGERAATLRHRRRDRDGGGYDAWSLRVQAGDRMLKVMVTDKGRDLTRFERWRENVLSVEWDASVLDTELAFGLSAGPIEGMHLDTSGAGALSYRSDAKGAGASLLFTAAPFAMPETDETCLALVAAGAKEMQLKTVRPAAMFTGAGARGCSSEATTATGKVMYSAFVVLPTGGVAAIGESTGAQMDAWRPRFEAAIRGMHPVRGSAEHGAK